MGQQVLRLCKSGVGYPMFEPLKGVGHDSCRLGVVKVNTRSF